MQSLNGGIGMSIFSKITQRIYYCLDSLKANSLNVKIEKFKFDDTNKRILVIYRLGRQKLLQKMEISFFEREYFEKISTFDQHRLTKFSTLQRLLMELFQDKSCNESDFIQFIYGETRSEQLF